MQLKVISLILASIAAAIALPPPPGDKGSLVPPLPKTSVPTPTYTQLPLPKSGVPHPDNAQIPGHDDDNDNAHLPRADANFPPKSFPPIPTNTQLSPPPLPTNNAIPPPKSDVSPTNIPVPHSDNAQIPGHDNTHLPRADAEFPPKTLPTPTNTYLPPPLKTGVLPVNTSLANSNNFKN